MALKTELVMMMYSFFSMLDTTGNCRVNAAYYLVIVSVCIKGLEKLQNYYFENVHVYWGRHVMGNKKYL